MLELVWGTQHPTVTGRAIGPDGQPLAGRSGRVELWQNHRRISSKNFRCDPDGLFTIIIEAPWESGSVRLARLLLGKTGNTGPLDAELELSYAIAPGGKDVGAVMFAGQPLLAAGWVVDQAGQPIASANVTAQYRKTGGKEEAWASIKGASANTDKDGHFRIYGASTAGLLSLAVHRRGGQSERFEFQSGASGLRVPFIRGDEGQVPEEERRK